MSFPRYAAYKDSGVEWLGEVPQGWEVKRLSWVFDVISSGTTPPSENQSYYDGDICWVTTGELRENLIIDTEKKITESALTSLSALKIYPAGTLLIALYGATIGRLGILGIEACTNQACCAMAYPRGIITKFCYYTLWAAKDHLIFLASGGGQPNINQEKIRSLRIATPPVTEQTTIAAFLDCETAKIDNLINEQKKLIELLKEKRQAVISHAVTKGLNPNAPMKDSGVEWLGEVPIGWEVKPIKKLGNIVSGYAFPSSDFVKEGEIRVLKISNIQTGYLDWSDESYLPKSSYIDNFSVKNGDIIFALTRPIISTGIKAAVATIGEGEIVLLNQRNALFRPFPIAERKFLYYILFDYNFKAAFENCIDSTGQQPNISPIDIGNIFVAVPPINEQTTIVAFLDQETTKSTTSFNKPKKPPPYSKNAAPP
jgi:type I restriction enzyme S subunit